MTASNSGIDLDAYESLPEAAQAEYDRLRKRHGNTPGATLAILRGRANRSPSTMIHEASVLVC